MASEEQIALDALMHRLAMESRLLPALTPANGSAERHRLAAALARGEEPAPAYRLPVRPLRVADRDLDRARELAIRSPAPSLYLERIAEIELELQILRLLGQPDPVRELSVARFGSPSTPVPIDADGDVPLSRVAVAVLSDVPDSDEEQTLPASSVAALIDRLATVASVPVQVRVEPRLAAGAAAGDRLVLVADRLFGPREARRIAVHEVLGHLVSAANGRAQRLGILEVGTAGSFGDQEGLAIWLEEQAGLLDGHRLRTLAARVVVADRMLADVPFGRAARELVEAHGFSPHEAVCLAERAYRGGGVARDVCYLAGWLRVRQAIASGDVEPSDLRVGRVGLSDVGALRELRASGAVRPPVYRPSLARSLAATAAGTSSLTSPPREVTSLTRFEAT